MSNLLLNDAPLRLAILDRDKTIVRVPSGIRHLCGDEPIEFVEGAPWFIRWLNSRGVAVVVATNQPGIDDRSCEETQALTDRFHERLNCELGNEAAHIDRFYVCPHQNQDRCRCRKPHPGLFEAALRDFECAANEAISVGDQYSDLAAASAAGIRNGFWLKTWMGRLAPVPVPMRGWIVPGFEQVLQRLGTSSSEKSRLRPLNSQPIRSSACSKRAERRHAWPIWQELAVALEILGNGACR